MTRPDLQFLTVDDFRAGIHTNTAYVGGRGAGSPSILGAATDTNTHRCYATPQGHLAPLPRKTDLTLPQLAQWGDNLEYFMCGFNAEASFMIGSTIANTSNSDRVDMHFFVVYQDGADFDWIWYRYRIYDTDNPALDIIHSGTESGEDVDAGKAFKTFIHTRMNPSNPTQLGEPVVVSVGKVSSTIYAKAFPDPSSAGTLSTVDVGTPGSGSTHEYLMCYGHQNRVAIFEFLTHGHGPDSLLPVADAWYWTNTNDNDLSSTIATPFVTENPSDISDAFSANANELLVLKSWGGGFLIRGSLDNPTVIQLPSLHSSLGAAGKERGGFKGTMTALGPLYAGPDGAYVWLGGDRDQHVSPQLAPDFWRPTLAEFQGHHGQAARWDDWAVLPGNWLLDTATGAWWRLEETSEADVVYFSQSAYRVQLYGLGYTIDNTGGAGNRQILWRWRKNQPSFSYSFQSQPLPNPENHIMGVREIAVTVQGSTQDITVTLINEDGTEVAHTWSDVNSPNTWTRFRAPINARGRSLAYRIECDGSANSNPAALVRDVSFGFDTKHHIPNET